VPVLPRFYPVLVWFPLRAGKRLAMADQLDSTRFRGMARSFTATTLPPAGPAVDGAPSAPSRCPRSPTSNGWARGSVLSSPARERTCSNGWESVRSPGRLGGAREQEPTADFQIEKMEAPHNRIEPAEAGRSSGPAVAPAAPRRSSLREPSHGAPSKHSRPNSVGFRCRESSQTVALALNSRRVAFGTSSRPAGSTQSLACRAAHHPLCTPPANQV